MPPNECAPEWRMLALYSRVRSVVPSWLSPTLPNEAESSHGAVVPVPPKRRITRPENELPKEERFPASHGPSVSCPPNTPASTLHGPRSQAPFTVHRSRICERWWLVGYFATG